MLHPGETVGLLKKKQSPGGRREKAKPTISPSAFQKRKSQVPLERISSGDELYRRFWISYFFFEHELEHFLGNRMIPDRGERLPVQR
jgi:hypothetical protein